MEVNKKYATKMQPICNQIKSDDVKFECKYCGNVFKHHQSMYKHMKYRCTDKNNVNDLKQQNEKLMNIVESQSKLAVNNSNFVPSETIKKSVNVLSFVTKQYPNAPAIEEIILFYFKNNNLPEILGKAIVEEYKKDDPEDQSMWPRQYSHLFKCEYFLCEKVL